MEDIFKKSFLEGYASTDITVRFVAAALCITFLISMVIFAVYRITTKKTFYSRDFNISLVCVALITATIIITIQSSIVVSLGMVGALSIVRFRTAIKNPMDLAFLFWAISVGIICGAGLGIFAVMLSAFASVVILVLKNIPHVKAPMILVINCTDIETEEDLLECIKKYSKHSTVKSRSISTEELDLTIELNSGKGGELVRELIKIDGVRSANLLQHDGEVVF